MAMRPTLAAPRFLVRGLLAGGLLLGLLAPFATAQGQESQHEMHESELNTLRSEVDALKQGQIELRQQLEAILQQLQRQANAGGQSSDAPRQEVPPIPLIAAAIRGAPDARIIVAEFSDYQCPFCKRHLEATLPQLAERYIDTGLIRYAMMEFPIDSIHPQARKASEAALCAGDQDRYWQMHDLIFAEQRQLAPRDLQRHAETLDLDMGAFEACLEEGTHADVIRRALDLGRQVGIRGTPSFLIGLSSPDEPLVLMPTYAIRGAQSLDVFAKVIDELLAELAKEAG